MYQHICAWCQRKFGKAEIKDSHGLCKDCHEKVLASIPTKLEKTIEKK